MPYFLILRLDGPMQAWGTHTFEDFRPSSLFPTRSGLLGLLGACLGIERRDRAVQEQLAASVEFTVRVDQCAQRPPEIEKSVESITEKKAVKLPDFHTVLAARKVDGSANKNPVVSRREYLFDAAFTVAVGEKPGASFSLDAIAHALRHPCFTPVLGRRSCPIARPLLDCGPVAAADAKAALAGAPPTGGMIYTEGEWVSDRTLQIRDVPMHGQHRQFGNRRIYVHKEVPCS
jgi:CRISPR system Cascade subunit CasD